jgi:PPOX class probable FMN-dependent enzyme
MPDDARGQSVTDVEKLTGIVGEPGPLVANKEMFEMDGYFLQYLSLYPFLCISSADAEGYQDVSPRGDPPGFVKALDNRTVLIPDRKGDRRVDTMKNILENPKVSLILFVPGIEEVVRINGSAKITEDLALLAQCGVNGVVPPLGIVVELDSIFFHCAKAIKRSKLWDPGTPIHRTEFPPFGQIVRDQRMPNADVAETEEKIQQEYKDRMY